MESLISTTQKTIQLKAHVGHDRERAADILRGGGIVALPTETVYGLAANGLCKTAIAKVFLAKKRPCNNPLILHVHNAEKAYKLFDFLGCPEAFKKRFDLLSEAFWPGPLTIVAQKSSHVPNEATGNLASVAARVPKNKTTQAIMECLDFPLVMPSANLSTRPSPTCADHVLKTLDGRIDAIIDDGACEVGIESTVVKIDGHHVVILRPGSIDITMIEDCLQEMVINHSQNHSEQPLSPGQSYLHYSPRVRSVEWGNQHKISQDWQSLDIVLSTKTDFINLENQHGHRPKNAITMVLSDEPRLYAQELYRALYACENLPEKRLLIIPPSTDSLAWHAIIDRLKRSAGAA